MKKLCSCSVLSRVTLFQMDVVLELFKRLMARAPSFRGVITILPESVSSIHRTEPDFIIC